MKKLTEIIAVGLMGLASLMPNGHAEEEKKDPVNLKQRVVVEDEESARTQTLVSKGCNRLMIENAGDVENYGLNVENDSFRLNIGVRDKEENDSGRVLVEKKFDGGFAGLEYQSLPGTVTEDRFSVYGGVDLSDRVDIQFEADNNQSVRAVLFAEPYDKHLFAIGGGKGRDGDREFNVGYSTMLTGRYGIGAHVRVGDEDFHDCRVRIGPNVSRHKARGLGVTDGCYNNISSGDVTCPPVIGRFSFFSADACVGDETGDIGVDLRHMNSKAYANVAVNVGDYGFFEDVTVSPEVHENRDTGVDGYRIGLSTELKDTGLKLWVQRNKDEGRDPETAAYIGWGMSF